MYVVCVIFWGSMVSQQQHSINTMLQVAPNRKAVACLAVNHLKYKHDLCFPLTAWKDHTDYFSQPQTNTAANTNILMKPIKNHRLGFQWHNWGKSCFRPSIPQQAT